jgi:hypothetical protein
LRATSREGSVGAGIAVLVAEIIRPCGQTPCLGGAA